MFAVAVCAVLSLLIHLTLVPRLMVMWAGLKLKFWIKTFLVGCLCGARKIHAPKSHCVTRVHRYIPERATYPDPELANR